MGLSKYLRLYRVQLKNNYVREAVYRTNFITSVMVDFIWLFVEILLFSVIYANTPSLAGWTKPQAFFFLGIFFASDAIFTAFFQRNYWMFSDLVNKGELDILLTKPVHPLFLALTRYIGLTSLLNVALGVTIIIRYASEAGFEGGWKWLWLPFWLLFGVIVQLLVRFSFSVWIFWTDRGFAISRLYYQFFQMATKPDVLYPYVLRYFLQTLLPFALIAALPTRALLFGLQTKELILCAAVIIGFLFLNSWLWHRGLRRYQSASS